MVTAGIIGTGWWGQELLKSARGSDAIRFVHGMSRHAESGAPVAAAHGLRFSTSLEAMLTDREVQAVVIATPHRSHRALIEAVAARGLPVFCEKPLTLTRADAVAAVAACQAAGVPLAVGHNRRFLPSLAIMQRILAEGRLGTLLHIEGHSSNENSSRNFAPWRADPEESPAGGMTGTGVHVIDAFTALVGPAKRVSTLHVVRKPPPGPLDSLSVLLEFACGISGTLAMVRATPRVWRLHLFGERGSVEAVSETEVVLRESGREPERIAAPEVDTLRAELEAFAAAAAGRAPYPLPLDQAVANVAAFEAIVQSLAQGGAPVEVAG
ncbi:Gfo/Idh/MocA family oxidoreductase [Siccirubricoccus sp. KC 17139]|uniref:Gfo/Idh/MocA family oxidoreductase n=1 Tax=Siccirubricoccus soli TaxID=2899147 RepID=A0ABT1D423_9PROT|nr:Gfo/Idh/MocA family oxidoreductase [Siccirubricoccus soli]MCO6416667.1 Gfo/Idh/MocA family oxidoreductase [Siccirubricoccus soli]MCP2682802.1 Gfo/Idh/MocA family oxidoreductase [Siccirubricoccus soli]